MRIITLQKLQIQNFLSVGEVPVVLNFTPGINGITGVNHDKEDSKNGVGKSTIVDALNFALFGSTIRELNKEQIINSVNRRNCEVQLIFDIVDDTSKTTYFIKRTLAPTKCTITKDGVDVTRSTLPKTNEYIQKLVKSTPKIFQNSIVMTINNTVPFMAQSKTDKRKFIESVLNLEVFSDMLLRARDELNDLKKEYEVTYTKYQTEEKNYNINKQQLDLFEENKQKKIKLLQQKINDNLNTIETVKKEIKTLPDEIEAIILSKKESLNTDLEKVQTSYNNILQKNSSVITQKQMRQKDLEKVKQQGSVCPACQREYSTDSLVHKEQHIKELEQIITKFEEDEKNINSTLEELVIKQNNFKQKINELQLQHNKISEVSYNNKALLSKIEYIIEQINTIKNEIKDAEKESNSQLEKVVKDQEQLIKELQNTVNKLDKDISILECVKFVVSEEGVKSYIVKKILKVLNSRLQYYLQRLEANCICQFNEYFEETVTDESGVEKSYFNFSGGERKRIDLACLFAFLDIRRMQGDVQIKTVFYDELLDSSLDNKGVEQVLDILKERYEQHNESCYIITHRGAAITDKVNNFIELEKKNGFTYVCQ